jgi:hypothetical protein
MNLWFALPRVSILADLASRPIVEPKSLNGTEAENSGLNLFHEFETVKGHWTRLA